MSRAADEVSRCPVTHGIGWLEQGFLADPFPVLTEHRLESPLFYDPELDHYVVTRYDDIEAILVDRDTFAAAIASSPIWPPVPEAQQVLHDRGYRRVPTLNNADPPRHPPMRKAVFTCMSPRRLRQLEPTLRQYARGLIRPMVAKPVADLVAELAFPLPAFAGLSLLGFPAEDTEQVKDWTHRRILFTYGRLPSDEQVRVAENVVAFWKYCEGFVRRRRARAADDLTSDLLRYADDHPDLLVDDDVVNIVYSIALAGHETTTSAIAGGLRHLLARPEQWAALCREPGLIPNAVEELLRFDPPILGWRRITTVATEVGGVAVPEGAKIVMLFASAHRDAAHFPDPDVLDVRRPNAVDHLSFGKGVHFCLGAPLARLEVRIVLELLTELAPDLRLVPGQSPAYSPNVLFRTLERLLVERPGS